MPPRKPRETRSTAPTPSPAPTKAAGGAKAAGRPSRSKSARNATDKPEEAGEGLPTVEAVVEEEEGEDGDETAISVGVAGVDVGGNDAVVHEGASEEDGGVNEEEEAEEAGQDDEEEESPTEVEEGASADVKGKGKVSMEDRMAKLKDLRLRMNQSSAANRRDLVSDHQKQKVTAKEVLRLEKQKKLAQTLRLKTEAEANGEDMERKKAWEWSIEQNERWEAKQEESKVKSDTHFHNAEDDAWKRYNRNIRSTKADLLAYEKQKEAALGLAPGTLVPLNATSQSLQAGGSKRGGALSLSEDLYRGADTLAYGDSKPSEDAVDRVTAKINRDIDKPGKRKKRVEEEGEINYINDRNKVFNKKVARYFDKYTKEIRANFERGTAL